jgi:hypothetical protein
LPLLLQAASATRVTMPNAAPSARRAVGFFIVVPSGCFGATPGGRGRLSRLSSNRFDELIEHRSPTDRQTQ